MNVEGFVPDYTPGVDTKCDMCFGTGEAQTYVTEDGEQIWGTTDVNWELPEGAKIAEVLCRTCGGTGIMPETLKPGYWQQRIEECKKGNNPLNVLKMAINPLNVLRIAIKAIVG